MRTDAMVRNIADALGLEGESASETSGESAGVTVEADPGGEIAIGGPPPDQVNPGVRRLAIFTAIRRAYESVGLMNRGAYVRYQPEPNPTGPPPRAMGTPRAEDDGWFDEVIGLVPDAADAPNWLRPYIRHDWEQWRRGRYGRDDMIQAVEDRIRYPGIPPPVPRWQ